MREETLRDGDRSQAFTLEGFIAAVVILTAVLFSLQAIVLTPTTGGTVDQEVRSQLRIQANDVLVTTAHNTSPAGQPNQNLSYLVRHWNGSETEDTWARGIDRTIGYGSNQPPTLFGKMLNESFKQRGRVYNVLVEYRNGTDPTQSEQRRMVYRGVPSDNAIVTTYTITLYDNETLTGPDADGTELWEYPTDQADPSTNYYPIPDAFPDSPLYNVIEVRVVVW